jgi:hypothetical protein
MIPNTPHNLQTQLNRELHLRQEHLFEMKHRHDFDPRDEFHESKDPLTRTKRSY